MIKTTGTPKGMINSNGTKESGINISWTSSAWIILWSNSLKFTFLISKESGFAVMAFFSLRKIYSKIPIINVFLNDSKMVLDDYRVVYETYLNVNIEMLKIWYKQ